MTFSDPVTNRVDEWCYLADWLFHIQRLGASTHHSSPGMEFRLAQHKEFLAALTEKNGKYTYETHLRFVNAMNAILLIGGSKLLHDLKELVENYNNPPGTTDKTWEIINNIIYSMRCDLGAPDTKELASFDFPILVPDLERLRENDDGQADHGAE